jgi:hypothetical protein
MITPVSVPVPYSGDGPAVDVSALVGPKTVQLSGTYEGYYDLLGSQDGQTFVPVASFNASGPEGIEQTIPGAFSSVKLRSGATGAAGVVCEVSGVAGSGQNGFGVVASLSGSSSGLTAVVDTSTFIPPTGSEADTCFLCRGSFTGPITILGSIDGVEFNPIGAWNPGRLPQGTPPVLEFAPITTEAKVRYVRLLVSGVVTGSTVVTMGGRVPPSGSGPSGTNVAIVTSSTLNAGFYFAGQPATGPVFTDALGNTVNYTGSGAYGDSDVVCVGSNNSAAAGEDPLVLIGTELSSSGSGQVSGILVLIGSSSGVLDSVYNAVLIGSNLHVSGDGSSYHVLMGDSLTVNTDEGYNVVIGQSITSGVTASGYNVLLGTDITVGDAAYGNLVIQPEFQDHIDLGHSTYNVLLGNGISADSHLNYCFLISGAGCSILNDGSGGQNIIVMGRNTVASAGGVIDFTNQVLLGTDITTTNPNAASLTPVYNAATSAVAIGDTILLQATSTPSDPLNNFNQAVLIGSEITSTATTFAVSEDTYCSQLVHIGSSITCGNTDGTGQGSFALVTIGGNITIGDAGQYIVAIGNSITIGEYNGEIVAIGSSVNIPDYSGGVIAIGIVNIESGCAGGIAIGSGVSLTNVGNYAMAFGSGASATDNQCVFGSSSDFNSDQSVHQFIVRGLYGSTPIDTLAAISNPSVAGDTGLYLVYTANGTVMQQVKVTAKTYGSLASGDLVACLVAASVPTPS